MSLADNLANILKDIFLIDLLTIKERDLTINDKLVAEFDNTKECKIDLVNK